MRKLTGQFKNGGGTGARAAFFDVDGTLIRGDSQDLEARYRLTRQRPGGRYLWSIRMTLAALQLNRLGWISLTRQNEIYLKGLFPNPSPPRPRLLYRTRIRFPRPLHRPGFGRYPRRGKESRPRPGLCRKAQP